MKEKLNNDMVLTNEQRMRSMSSNKLAGLVRAVISNESCPMGDLDCLDCLFYSACVKGEYWYGREDEWLELPVEE
jgi:hypothetical protein